MDYKGKSKLYVTSVFENNTLIQLKSPFYPSTTPNLHGMKLRVVCIEVSNLYTLQKQILSFWYVNDFTNIGCVKYAENLVVVERISCTR